MDAQERDEDLLEDSARRITERVRQLTGDTAPGPALQTDQPTGEAPPLR